MAIRLNIVLLVPIFLLVLLRTEAEGGRGLRASVERFSDSEVSSKNLEKLTAYDDYISYFSGISYFQRRHKVSPDFVRALILAESGANPMAISEKNARGLGQILYPTGVQAGKELSSSFPPFRHVSHRTLSNLREQDLFDPAVNILLTCYLIAKYNYMYSGRLDLVVSAWNAGEYTESLKIGRHAPYKETEELIGKINAYYLYLLKNRTSRQP
jgi:soluble lytic murein transglycosylase-like protein